MTPLLWFLLACGAPSDPKGAALPEPWKALALPIGEGEVIERTDTALKVIYPERTAPVTVAARWARALEARGLQVGDPVATGPAVLMEVTGREPPGMLAVVENRGRIEVHLDLE